MKAIIVCAVLLFAASPIQSGRSLRTHIKHSLNHDEKTFWKRFLNHEASLSADPATKISDKPSDVPSDAPTKAVSEVPTTFPSDTPTIAPSETPSDEPASFPSDAPTTQPSDAPTTQPSDTPTALPSATPTIFPSDVPTSLPSDVPTTVPSDTPTVLPSENPTTFPSDTPTFLPSNAPTSIPSGAPTTVPSNAPTLIPSSLPSGTPTIAPKSKPSTFPSNQPSLKLKTTKNPTNADGSVPDPEVTCQIQADVVCHQIANGKPCEAIQLQTTDCNGDLNSMSFFYFPKPCSQPENVCEDFGLLSNILPASIKCNDDDSNELAVIPSTVNPNATFQVQNMNATSLPLVITCLITNAALNAAQIVTIQQSKHDEKNEFAQDYGSLRRVACATKSCEREILYEIVIYNTGETNVTVSNITVFNNNAEIKVPLPEKKLLPDQFITLDLPSNVNACKIETYTTEVEVDAKELLRGSKCRAQANSTTDILPDCMVDVNMKCTLDKQDGLDCSDLSKPTAQCICETCVDRLVFRYTAARCSEPKPGNKRLASCIDREQDNTTNAPDAHIVITAGDRMLFNGIVTEGGDIVLNDDGECIGDAIDVLLAPTPGGLGILQNIRLDTSCKYGSEITLLESYGALTLIGYTCLDGEENKCFVDVTYNFTADNVGDVDFLLSNFTLFAKNTKNNLIQDVNATDLFLPRGKQYDVIAKETLNICSSEEPFVATLQAVGSTKALNSSCLSEKQATVQLQTECNTPSDKPSDQPSNIPSDSPSSAPNEYPPSMTSYKSTRYKYKCMMSSKSKKSNSSASSKYGPTTSMMSFKRTASPTSLPSTNEVFDVPNGKGGKGYSHFPGESRA